MAAFDLLPAFEDEPDPEEAVEPAGELDPAEEGFDPEEEPELPDGAAEDAAVVELVPLSELVWVSVFDSPLLPSAGLPLFSDLLPGSFILSE